MSTDFEMVTTVKREFARRLPSELEFANWANAERKRAWLYHIKNRTWLRTVSMLQYIANMQVNIYTPTGVIIKQCPREEILRECGAPLVRTWMHYLNIRK